MRFHDSLKTDPQEVGRVVMMIVGNEGAHCHAVTHGEGKLHLVEKGFYLAFKAAPPMMTSRKLLPKEWMSDF